MNQHFTERDREVENKHVRGCINHLGNELKNKTGSAVSTRTTHYMLKNVWKMTRPAKDMEGLEIS